MKPGCLRELITFELEEMAKKNVNRAKQYINIKNRHLLESHATATAAVKEAPKKAERKPQKKQWRKK